jgi:hypothetical protein
LLSWQEQMLERKQTLENDRKVREQQNSGTFLSHTHSDLGGRYSGVGAQTVVGAEVNAYSSLPKMPEGNPWAHDPVPNELPTGYRIDALYSDDLGAPPAQGVGPASEAPSGLPSDVWRPDAGLSSLGPSHASARATDGPPAQSAPRETGGPSSFSRLRRRRL